MDDWLTNRSPELPVHRIYRRAGTLGLVCLLTLTFVPTYAAEKPRLFQSPALSRELIAFGYAGDLWTVSREGGRAVRLTNFAQGRVGRRESRGRPGRGGGAGSEGGQRRTRSTIGVGGRDCVARSGGASHCSTGEAGVSGLPPLTARGASAMAAASINVI
jgi:hypothetical protein